MKTHIDYTKVKTDKDGYLTYKSRPVHKIVWEDNYGEIPKGYEIHHIDMNKTNNDIKNLMLVTPFEHKKIHGNSKLINGEWFKKCADCEEIKNEKKDFYSNERQVYFVCKKCWNTRVKKTKNKIIEKIVKNSGMKVAVKDRKRNNYAEDNLYLITQEEFDMKLMNAFLFNNVWCKKCTKCKEIKILSEMERRHGTKSGIGSVCIHCKKILK